MIKSSAAVDLASNGHRAPSPLPTPSCCTSARQSRKANRINNALVSRGGGGGGVSENRTHFLREEAGRQQVGHAHVKHIYHAYAAYAGPLRVPGCVHWACYYCLPTAPLPSPGPFPSTLSTNFGPSRPGGELQISATRRDCKCDCNAGTDICCHAPLHLPLPVAGPSLLSWWNANFKCNYLSSSRWYHNFVMHCADPAVNKSSCVINQSLRFYRVSAGCSTV